MGYLGILRVFLFVVSIVSTCAHPEDILRSIKDLEAKDFGHNYPRHGLYLLYWLSHEYISFDNNNNMRPKKDPNSGAYGFHYYGNKEEVLPSLQNLKGYAYYTVGNLYDNNNNEHLAKDERLPDYVINEFSSSKNLDSRDQNNKDRIIVRRTPFGNIDRVYITQHYDYSSSYGSTYDRDNTYGISSDLLRDIRNVSLENFLRPFPKRVRTHYALCHPGRGKASADPASKECDHAFSSASAVTPHIVPLAVCSALAFHRLIVGLL